MQQQGIDQRLWILNFRCSKLRNISLHYIAVKKLTFTFTVRHCFSHCPFWISPCIIYAFQINFISKKGIVWKWYFWILKLPSIRKYKTILTGYFASIDWTFYFWICRGSWHFITKTWNEKNNWKSFMKNVI